LPSYDEYNQFFSIIWFTDDLGEKISIQRLNEQQKIINNKIILNNIPDYFNKVNIEDKYEVGNNDEITDNTFFKVDYLTGEVYFHPSLDNTTITIKDYFGRGIIKFMGKRIELQNEENLYNATNIEDFATDVTKRVNNIVANTGDDNTEIVDARYSTMKDKLFSVLSGRLEEIENDYLNNFEQRAVNVKMPPFNAKSNDIDDDYEVIQSALDYCYTNNLPIYFPGGIYKVTQKLLFRLGQIVFGAGYNSAIIKQYGNFAVAGTADPNKNTGASMITPFCGHIVIHDIQFLQTTTNNGLDIECSLRNKLKKVKIVGNFIRGSGSTSATNGLNIHGRADANYGSHYTAVETCFIQNFVYGIRVREKSNDIFIQDTAVSNCYDSVHIDYDSLESSRPSRVLVLSNSLEQFDNAGIWSDSYGPNNIFAFGRMDTDSAPYGIYLGANSREQVCIYNYYAGCTDKIYDLGSNYIQERVEINEIKTIIPKAIANTIGELEHLWFNGFFKKIFLERTEIAPSLNVDDIGTIFIARGLSYWNPGHDNGVVKGSAYPVMWDSSNRWKPLAKPKIDVWGDQSPDTAGSLNTYLVGDNCINLTPAEGKPIGWLCVTGGTPGAWKPYGQVGHRENAGTPVGTITPYFIGEELLDATNKIWYKSVGLTNSDWKALNS